MRYPEWKIPDDGDIDETAIEITVKGQRRVRLTETEVLIAARQIRDNGGTAETLQKHTGMSYRHARRIMVQLREDVSSGQGSN